MNSSKIRFVGAALGAIAVWAAAPVAFAQPSQDRGDLPRTADRAGGEMPPIREDNRPFDPKDFNGVWQGSLYSYGRVVPEFTPEGKKRFEANKPSYGIALNSPAAKAATNVDIGRKRAVPPALNNDPVGKCNPLGLIRLIVFSTSPMEVIQTKDRIIQRFEWTYDHREIWQDGRKLPNVDDYLPRWNGYSVGHWEGDTLVVDTVGLDDRQWIDHFGYPIGAHARLQERWRRINFSTIEINMVIDDPETYKTPWKSDPARFRLVEGEVAPTVWNGLVEDKCVPLDNDVFYDTAVQAAAGLPAGTTAPKK